MSAGAGVLEGLARELARLIAGHLHDQLTPTPTSQPDGESPWLSIERAAAYLDWPRQRLYKLTAAHAIPFYKHEGRLLFHRAELDAWLHDHQQSARPDAG